MYSIITLLVQLLDQYSYLLALGHLYHIKYQMKVFISGSILQSYLILCANIISGFNMWKHIALYFYHKYSLGSQILYCKCVQLYVAFVKIYLITIQTAAQSSVRCVQSASTRCVFKILNITRFFLLLALKWILISFLIACCVHSSSLS